MATQAKAETVTLRLEQQIDRAADAAVGALGRLERQIAREQNALGRLENSLISARAKLDTLANGTPSDKAVLAFQKQQVSVKKLDEMLQSASVALGKMSTGSDPKAVKSATNEVEKLKSKLAEAKSKLDALSGPASGGIVDLAAFKKQRDAVAILTDKLGAQRDKIEGMREAHSAGKPAAEQLGNAIGLVGKETGIASGRVAQLGQAILSLGPYGAVAAAAILGLFGAVSLFVGIIAKGLESSGKMRAELLQLQSSSVASAGGMHWLFNATRESWVQAEKLEAMIGRVNATSSLGRSKLAEYAAQINAARFRGAQAETVLKAMSVAGSAGTEAMAKEVFNWAKAMRFAGGSVDGLAARVEQKLGKTALAKAIALDVQMKRFGDNLTWIFGGADTDPILRAIDSVLRLFNEGSSSATTMRTAIKSLVDWAIGGMLRLGIAVLRTYIALRENETAWNAVKFVVKAAALGFALVAGAALTVVGAVIATNLACIGLVSTIGGLLVLGLKKAWEGLSNFATLAREVGTNIVEGLANGITSAGPKIWEALKSAVGGAVRQMVNLLKIGSPSKLTFGYGVNVDEGMAGGIDSGSGEVAAAAADMTNGLVESSDPSGFRLPTPAKSAQSARGESQQSSPGKAVNFHNCTFGSVTEGQIRQWTLAAMESEALDAGAAA